MFVVVVWLSSNWMQTSGNIGILSLSTRYQFHCCLVAIMWPLHSSITYRCLFGWIKFLIEPYQGVVAKSPVAPHVLNLDIHVHVSMHNEWQFYAELGEGGTIVRFWILGRHNPRPIVQKGMSQNTDTKSLLWTLVNSSKEPGGRLHNCFYFIVLWYHGWIVYQLREN